MSYRETAKARKYRLMREAKERKRVDNCEPREPTWTPPDLRREIIVINHDTGEAHGFKLYKTDRIDQYRVTVDGRQWKEKAGFAKVLEGIRKAMPPMRYA